jgi:hypothetical protein
MQATGKALKMTDTFGHLCEMPLARYDHDSSSWRTCEVTSLWDLPMSLQTLPTWGCLHDGVLCEHQTPERLTIERDFSLLPTPAVNDMGRGKDPEWWDEWSVRQKAADGRPAPHGKSLEQEALKMRAMSLENTRKRLDVGKESLEGKHHTLPFTSISETT